MSGHRWTGRFGVWLRDEGQGVSAQDRCGFLQPWQLWQRTEKGGKGAGGVSTLSCSPWLAVYLEKVRVLVKCSI